MVRVRAPSRQSTERARGRRAARRNRKFWDATATEYEARHSRSLSAAGGLAWGFWQIPEAEVRLLGPVSGRRILELGCGAGRWAVGLRQRRAHVVALDLSMARLRQARSVAQRGRVRLPLLRANAESLPFRSAAFDTVFCDWGAMTFADPLRIVPEVARVLRPGGVFAFSSSSPIRFIGLDRRTDRMSRRMVGRYFGQHRIEFEDSVDYSLPYGEWVRLFTRSGLIVEELLEPQGRRDRRSSYLSRQDQAWAADFPLELLWRLRRATERRGGAGAQASSRGRLRRRR